nr:MAG TPA: putative metal-binding protein [Caudoviricetes sp.]
MSFIAGTSCNYCRVISSLNIYNYIILILVCQGFFEIF